MTTTAETSPRPHRDAHPRAKQVAKSLLLVAVLPAVVLFGVYLALGKVIMGPLGEIKGEESVSKWFVDQRTSALSPITKVISTANDTWYTIGLAIAFGLIILALTRKWWLGIIPVVAITVESSIFVPVTTLADRPRPEVSRLDEAPPTSSFPSGHTAASFALYWSLMFLASRIRNTALRTVVQVVCFVFPFLVGTSRLYRGMHHLTDVLLGMVLGILSAILTYRAITHAERHATR